MQQFAITVNTQECFKNFIFIMFLSSPCFMHLHPALREAIYSICCHLILVGFFFSFLFNPRYACSITMVNFYWTTWQNVPAENILHSKKKWDLKFNFLKWVWTWRSPGRWCFWLQSSATWRCHQPTYDREVKSLWNRHQSRSGPNTVSTRDPVTTKCIRSMQEWSDTL
jgi:hypothetical protein